MIRLSANLGFLWTGMPLADAIRHAAEAGFAAVECHWPYDEDLDAVAAALADTGLPMLGLNTRKGGRPGDFGIAAVPGREEEARAAIAEAIACGARIGARAVHVMAGTVAGPEAEATYAANLAAACEEAGRRGMEVLIEPINHRDVPGYHLNTLAQAAEVIARVGRPELRILFDCYHTQITEGDLTRRFEAHRGLIGHVQIAAVPSRAEPDEGEVAYDRLLRELDRLGYDGFVGAEYRPRTGQPEDGLGWMSAFA